MPAAPLAYRAQRMAFARLPPRPQPTTAPPPRSSRRCSDGRAIQCRRSTRRTRIASASAERLVTCWRTTSEHLFPHLSIRCGREDGNANENNGEKSRWWAREDSNLQPDRYERGYFIGNVDEIWYFPSLQPTDVHDRLRPIVGEALVGVAGRQAFITRLPERCIETGRDLSHHDGEATGRRACASDVVAVAPATFVMPTARSRRRRLSCPCARSPSARSPRPSCRRQRPWRIRPPFPASPSDSRWRSAHRNSCRAECAIPAVQAARWLASGRRG